MRFKAILAEEARKRYPLSILLMVVGVLAIPFTWLFMRYGLELTTAWWTAFGIALGIVVAGLLAGVASIVEDVHDVSMHTVGFDLEMGEIEFVPDDEDDMPESAEEAPEADDEAPVEEAPEGASPEE